MEFDEIILTFAIQTIEESVKKLKTAHGVDNPVMTGEKALGTLKSIKTNKSLNPKYNIMFNQCIVLLVSYFGSAICDIFQVALTLKVNTQLGEIAKEEIKLTLGEIVEYEIGLWDIGELFTLKKEISFQDMQSISRVFRDYIGINIEKDENVHNIIVSQACRHVIVHLANKVDKKLIKQVGNAFPRMVKELFTEGELVQFTPDEIKVVGESMENYIDCIIEKMKEIGIG